MKSKPIPKTDEPKQSPAAARLSKRKLVETITHADGSATDALTGLPVKPSTKEADQ